MHSARHVTRRILNPGLLNLAVSYDVASTIHLMMDSARHVTRRVLNPGLLNQAASYHVASTMERSPRHQTHSEPWFIDLSGILRRGEHVTRRILQPGLLNQAASYDVASTIHPTHVHGGDLLPFRDLSLFLSQLVLEA